MMGVNKKSGATTTTTFYNIKSPYVYYYSDWFRSTKAITVTSHHITKKVLAILTLLYQNRLCWHEKKVQVGVQKGLNPYPPKMLEGSTKKINYWLKI